MKIVIVEDDVQKLKQLSLFIEQNYSGAFVRHARSYNTGLDAILDDPPDLVLLDMSLPTFDVSPQESGGRSRHFGGRELLSEIKRANLECCAIVVTQFETFGDGVERMTLQQIREQLASEYSRWYAGVVSYQPSESGWRDELLRLLKQRGLIGGAGN